MSQEAAAKQSLAASIQENWSTQLVLGGSQSGYVACYAANQALGTIWRGSKEEEPDTKEIRDRATLRRLADIGARDVVEAMLAAQMVATHEAAMECFRRAALSENSVAVREMGLKFADRLVRSFATLTDALNRHRGKSQQVVRVEHVNVQAGGQAIVGAVNQRGGGHEDSEDRAHAQRAGSRKYGANTQSKYAADQHTCARPTMAHAPEPTLRSPDPSGQLLPVASGEGQETLPDARRGRGQRRPGR